MAKRNQRKKKKKRAGFDAAAYNKIENLLILASDKIQEDDHDEAMRLCERVIDHRKATRKQRSEGYAYAANIFGMMEEFTLSFNGFMKAVEYAPEPQWELLYNRATSAMYTSQLALALRDLERALELCDDPEWVGKLEEKRQFMADMVRQSCELRGEHFTVDDLLEQQNHFHRGMGAMEAGNLDTAESAFKSTISMGEVLPQPRYNLGNVYAMRGDWDMAEQMWRGAIEVDPDYVHAQHALKMLPDLRSGEQTMNVVFNEPYKGSGTKLKLHYLE